MSIQKLFFCLLLLCSSCAKNSEDHTLFILPCEQEAQVSIEGYTKETYSNKNPKSIGHYSDGYRNGFWKFFYEDGTVQQEGNYTKGIKNGFWKTYYKNGNVKHEGHYQNCQPKGFWKFYNEDHSNITQKEL